MKTKLTSTIIAVLMFLTGCTQNPGDIQLSEEYLPLQMGNNGITNPPWDIVIR